MNRSRGFTLIEVLVALALLAIVSAALLAILPVIKSGTKGSAVDTRQSQDAISVFEEIAYAWSNPGYGWNPMDVGGQSLDQYVTDNLPGCHVKVTTPGGADPVSTDVIHRVVITCDATGNLPARELRAEFGNPSD